MPFSEQQGAIKNSSLTITNQRDPMHSSEYISSHLLDDDSQTEDLSLSCSSTCSGASTVMSAFSSMEASVSFPPVSSALSFDLASRAFAQFTGGRDQSPACAKTWDMPRSTRARSMDNNNHYIPRLHPYERRPENLSSAVATGTGIGLSKPSTPEPRPFLKVEESSSFEEYSLGSGNPWDSHRNID